ncbi:MAG: hypothetical protein MUO92_02190, partial [Dehalococcoidales bacterium]|nr:hypothetical protein [Dehalococcoidales bacterium]
FGWGIKNFKVLGKYSVLAGNILNGIGVGTAAKVLLDPPIPVRANVSRGCSPCNEHRAVVAQNRTQVHQVIQTAPVQVHHAQVQAAIQTQDNYIPWRE